MKFLIWAILIVLVLAWLMRPKAVNSGGTGRASSRPSGPDALGKPEAMLPCSRCGTHIPASEAIEHASGAVFCSEEHQRQAFPGT